MEENLNQVTGENMNESGMEVNGMQPSADSVESSSVESGSIDAGSVGSLENVAEEGNNDADGNAVAPSDDAAGAEGMTGAASSGTTDASGTGEIDLDNIASLKAIDKDGNEQSISIDALTSLIVTRMAEAMGDMGISTLEETGAPMAMSATTASTSNDAYENQLPTVTDCSHVRVINSTSGSSLMTKQAFASLLGVIHQTYEIPGNSQVELPFKSGLIIAQNISLTNKKTVAVLYESGSGDVISSESSIVFFEDIEDKICIKNTGSYTKYIIKNNENRVRFVVVTFIL